MGGGGKGGTSTSTVKIPKEVLARYNAVNTRAETAAAQPFQQYGGQFVAGINPNQQAGINATSAAAGIGQDYYNQAREMMAAGSGAVNPDELDINKYLSPYTENVVEATRRGQEQQNRQQAQQLTGNAISQGAFGGDRAGIAQANLAGQQSLANQQTLAGLRQQGYTQALGAAQQQQGLGYQAQAANLARQMQGGQGLASLGTTAQGAALQGAQAQIGAGTLEQQTQQAGLSALYNQFLQQQGFPYQQAQFLAGIAEGTGALSGSTTTNQQPTSFFSDERLKEDIKPIGKTFDGQPIYSYKMKGDPRTQIGLLAQEVEHHHPEAVGLARGYKTVDYDKATEHAAHRGHFYRGGLAASEGGHVYSGHAGEGYADGGVPIGGDIQAILAAQKAMYPYQQAGMYGMQQGTGPHGIAMPQQDIAGLSKAFQSRIAEPPSQRSGGLGDAISTASNLTNLYKGGRDIYKDASSMGKTPDADYTPEVSGSMAASYNRDRTLARGGRAHYDMGGAMPYGQAQGSPLEDVLKEQKKDAPDAPKAAAPPAAGPSGAQQALQAGAQIAAMAALLARGGAVHGYASGGLANRNGYDVGGVGTLVEDPRDPVLEAAQRALERIPLPRAGAPSVGANQTNRIPQSELPSFARPTGPLRVDQPVTDAATGLFDRAASGVQGMAGPARDLIERAGQGLGAAYTPSIPTKAVAGKALEAVTPDPRSPLARAYEYGKGVAGAAVPFLGDVGRLTTQAGAYLGRSPEAGGAGVSEAFNRLGTSAEGLGRASGLLGEPQPAVPITPTQTVPPTAREPSITAPAVAPSGGLAPTAPVASAPTAPMTFEQITRARENPNGPIDLVHPGGTAAGVYGINRPTWESVRSQNPDAGLMPYDALFGANKQDVPGTVQTAQQRLALDLLQQSNGSILTNAGVPVNNGTLSSAHFLGAPTAIALNQAPKDMPIQQFFAGLPGSDADKASILQQMPGVNTVGDALARQEKNWLNAGQTATGLAGAARPPSVSPTLDKLQQATLGSPPTAPEAKASTPDFKAPPPVTEAEFRARAQKELPGQQNWLDRNQGWLVPLLSGLGTMASSDSRYLGSAILQGVGGAAATYPEMQKAQQDILQSNLANQQKFADLAAADFRTIAGRQMVYIAGKQQPVQYGEWLSAGSPPTAHQAQYMQSLGYSPEDIAGMAAGKMAVPKRELDPVTTQQIAEDNNFMNRATDAQRTSMIEGSTKFHQDVQDAADVSSNMLRNTQYAAKTIAGLSEADVGPSALSDIRAMIINNLNAVAANIPGVTARINPEAQDLRQELAKLNSQIAFANVSASDQKSLAALQTAAASNPGKDLSLGANKAILAKLASDQQRDIDEGAYLDQYRQQFPDPSNYIAQNAERAFRKIYTNDRYRKEASAIEDLLNKDPETYKMLVDGRFSAEEIDGEFDKKGLPNMSRYFLGGM